MIAPLTLSEDWIPVADVGERVGAVPTEMLNPATEMLNYPNPSVPVTLFDKCNCLLIMLFDPMSRACELRIHSSKSCTQSGLGWK